MIVQFYVDGEEIDYANQAAIPRTGDTVTIDYVKYNVLDVNWNYDIREIKIQLERAN